MVCTGNVSVAYPTNMADGRRLRLLFEADGSPRNITLNSSWYNAPAARTPVALNANSYFYAEFTQLDILNGRWLSEIFNYPN
jgi:hypothetical protein